MHTERSDIDLSFSEILVEQQVFVYISDATGYIYTILDLLHYNPLIIYELMFHMVFSVVIDHVVKKECCQFLLNCSHASWC